MCELRTIGSPRAVQRARDHPHENTTSRCEALVHLKLGAQTLHSRYWLATLHTRRSARPTTRGLTLFTVVVVLDVLRQAAVNVRGQLTLDQVSEEVDVVYAS